MTDKFFRGDVVFAINPLASAHIQQKPRPYLIISNNKCNQHSDIVLGIPLTTKKKNNLPTHYRFMFNGRLNTALAEQIIPLDKSNINNYLDTISDYDLKQIEDRVKIQLDLKGE